jgi:tRNA(fMet)-specific endonuclease VapC
MLDTNICGYIIRDKPKNLKVKMKEVDLYHTLVLSVIVVSELLYGAKKKNNFKLIKIVSAFIDNFVIMDSDEVSALEYVNIRIYLESTGKKLVQMIFLLLLTQKP